MKYSLTLKKYNQEGFLSNTYGALRNILQDGEIKDFNTDNIAIDLNNPLNIECQPSYDGTVNLIINDDNNPPRIINTRFSKLEDNKYKIINRNQLHQSNLYDYDKIDQQTRLFRNLNKFPKIELNNITFGGNVLGGNYTFYIKLADSDYNKTDIVAESGIVSVFKGDRPHNISGTVYNERTDKIISLDINNIDESFSKLYIYYTRETCSMDGIRLTQHFEITEPYDITSSSMNININGYESVNEISSNDLNIQYNVVEAVKTQTQIQNRLFFGNVQNAFINHSDLQNISYYIKVRCCQSEKSIGYINGSDYTNSEKDNINDCEYYNPRTIYNNLGYWPDEIYRLGIVYILNNDQLSPVFNLYGRSFSETNIYNNDFELEYTSGTLNNNTFVADDKSYGWGEDEIEPNDGSLFKDSSITNECPYFVANGTIKRFVATWPNLKTISRNTIFDNNVCENTYGIFKTPSNLSIIGKDDVKPLYFQIEINDDIKRILKHNGIKGFFIVRQKRIPTTIAQGFSMPIDNSAHIPLFPKKVSDKIINWCAESFLDKNRVLTNNFSSHTVYSNYAKCSGLICPDAMCVPQIANYFNGSNFKIRRVSKGCEPNQNDRHITCDVEYEFTTPSEYGVVFIPENTPLVYINKYKFSTQCGVAEDLSQFSFLGNEDYSETNQSLLRGLYAPYLGVMGRLSDYCIYDIKITGYSELNMKNYFQVRANDKSPFYSVSHRYLIDDEEESYNIYRGDCYSCTTTIRLNRNFIDPEVPISNNILDPNTWRNNYKGYLNTDKGTGDINGSYLLMNRADVNTVDLGVWITFKHLSSFNLGLRAEDKRDTGEMAIMGNHRSFYPISDITTPSPKINDSYLLNQGYGATVGQRMNFAVKDVPYIKEIFDNRVMFSNIQKNEDFQNSYRIFQGLTYKDIDRQYGAIVKFIPLYNNILCVFEHGIGLIPINEKALISTTTGQSIHMYGADVLQNQITPIDTDFGSTWPESIIKTPKGVYGVDTYAKKIWRIKFTKNGPALENISDVRIQQFLNEHLKLTESDKYPIIGLKNVKTHYNNYKGDLMFTFYNEQQNENWNVCYNERLGKWVTNYTWTPLYSENINNIFYSLDQKQTRVLSYIYNNQNCEFGIRVGETQNQWDFDNDNEHVMELIPVGYITDNFKIEVSSIKTAYVYENEETVIEISGKPDFIEIANNRNLVLSKEDLITYSEEHWPSIIPVWFQINIVCTLMNENETKISDFSDTIGLVLSMSDNNQTDIYLKNGFYLHGRAGVFDELDYSDEDLTNQILPTKWYNKREKFEFEFVVKDPIGVQKIIDNIIIISNNVQPEEIEYEIIGDVYQFNKTGIYWNKPWIYAQEIGNYKISQELENCFIKRDDVLNTYTLVVRQQCKDIADPKYGRLLGNVHYKDDSWRIVVDPIYFKTLKKTGSEEPQESSENSTRIRDKWVKIRVRYDGKDLAIITAIQTLFNV